MALGKLLSLHMGVTTESHYRVMGELKERCLAPCTKAPATVSVASTHVHDSGCRDLGGSSEALPTSNYGHLESDPREELGRPRTPEPQLKGPRGDY